MKYNKENALIEGNIDSKLNNSFEGEIQILSKKEKLAAEKIIFDLRKKEKKKAEKLAKQKAAKLRWKEREKKARQAKLKRVAKDKLALKASLEKFQKFPSSEKKALRNVLRYERRLFDIKTDSWLSMDQVMHRKDGLLSFYKFFCERLF